MSSPNITVNGNHRSRAAAIASASPPRAPLSASVAAAPIHGGGGYNGYNGASSGVYGGGGGTPYGYSPAGSVGGSVYGTPSSAPGASPPPRHPQSSSNSGYNRNPPSGGGLLSGLGGFSLGGITKALASAVETQLSPAVAGMITNAASGAGRTNPYGASEPGGGGATGAAGNQGHAVYYDKYSHQQQQLQSGQHGPPKVALNFGEPSLGRRQSSFGTSDSSDAEEQYSERTYGQDSPPGARTPEDAEKLKAQLTQKLTSLKCVVCLSCIHFSFLSNFLYSAGCKSPIPMLDW